jgi:hypothetical protein
VSLGYREDRIQRLCLQYGVDWQNANKLYEYEVFRGSQMVFNTLVGGFCAYKFNPFRINAMKTYTFFRKSWMQIPM